MNWGYKEEINGKNIKPNPRENRKTTKDKEKGKHHNPKSAKSSRLSLPWTRPRLGLVVADESSLLVLVNSNPLHDL